MEYRADSDAVRIQGEKEPLASGLRKINASAERSKYSGSKAEEASASMFIVNPFTGDTSVQPRVAGGFELVGLEGNHVTRSVSVA